MSAPTSSILKEDQAIQYFKSITDLRCLPIQPPPQTNTSSIITLAASIATTEYLWPYHPSVALGPIEAGTRLGEVLFHYANSKLSVDDKAFYCLEYFPKMIAQLEKMEYRLDEEEGGRHEMDEKEKLIFEGFIEPFLKSVGLTFLELLMDEMQVERSG